MILLHEDTRTGGFAGELAAIISEEAFEYLDGPIRRITAPDTPVPYSPPLEEFFLPKVSDVIRVAANFTHTNRKSHGETKVIMPQMGESIFEGTLTKWLKKPGDKVERDEPLFEISTDKVDSEIPSPASGILQEILVKEGQTVQINTVVAIIGDGTAKLRQPPRSARGKAGCTHTPKLHRRQRPATAEEGDEAAPGHVSPHRAPHCERTRDRSAALAGKGTGINGRITKSDILHLIAKRAEGCSGLRRRHSRRSRTRADDAMRKSIAEHMVVSRRTSAHVTTFFEVDCSRIMKAREKLKAEFERAGVI